MSPDDERHGSEAGHEQHLRDDEQPCSPCRRAKILAARRRHKRKVMGHVYTLPLGEKLHTRLVDLLNRGATHEDIAEWSGVAPSEVWRHINRGPQSIAYARTYRRFATMQPGPIITPIGITRRIQALTRLGYSPARIAQASGCHLDTIVDARRGPRDFLANKVKEGILAAYDQLHMTPAAPSRGATRMRNMATRRRWPPPLAWDETTIDDPRARPVTGSDNTRRDPDTIDPVVVDRLLALQHVPSTRAEKDEAMRRWVAAGRSKAALCRAHGWQENRYGKGDAA